MPISTKAWCFELCRMGTAAHIFREIWNARCRARFDGTRMNARNICLRIISKVQLFSMIAQPNRRCTILQQNSLDILGLRERSVFNKKEIWCHWEKPPEGEYKLNVDGSSRVHGTTGGVLSEIIMVCWLRLSRPIMAWGRIIVRSSQHYRKAFIFVEL